MASANTNEVKLARIVNLKNYEDAVLYGAKDSPRHQERIDRLEAAKIHAAKYAEVKAAAARLGYKLNAYPVRTAGGTFEPLSVWIHSANKSFMRYEVLLGKLGVDLSNLPAIAE